MSSGGKSAGCRGVCVKRLGACHRRPTTQKTLGAWHKRLYNIGLAMADRPPRLHQVFQRYDPPLYFVTFNMHKRQNLLINADVHDALIRFA